MVDENVGEPLVGSSVEPLAHLNNTLQRRVASTAVGAPFVLEINWGLSEKVSSRSRFEVSQDPQCSLFDTGNIIQQDLPL